MSFEVKKKAILRQQRIAKYSGMGIGIACKAITFFLPSHIKMMARNYVARCVSGFVINRNGIKYVANSPTSYIRIFFTSEKEAETCEWINSFPKESIFWDVGANVGVFSLMAAKRNIKTYAFEPHPANYLNLVQNIDANQFSDLLAVFPVALYDHTSISPLHLTSLEAGMAWNSFSTDDNEANRPCKIQALGISIDEFIDLYKLPIPTHIKMDVDGNELKIFQGAIKTLSNPILKEILVEIDSNEKPVAEVSIDSLLKNAGFQQKHFYSHNHRYGNAIYVRAVS
jgi:FkbM family methyltransferase